MDGEVGLDAEVVIDGGVRSLFVHGHSPLVLSFTSSQPLPLRGGLCLVCSVTKKK